MALSPVPLRHSVQDGLSGAVGKGILFPSSGKCSGKTGGCRSRSVPPVSNQTSPGRVREAKLIKRNINPRGSQVLEESCLEEEERVGKAGASQGMET